MSQRVCAVVVTFNRLPLLRQCIAAIRAQTRQPDEIIVVNSGSADGTAEWLVEQRDITTISQENLGSAGAYNTGFQAAYDRSHDWIWSSDDDGFPDPNSLRALLDGAVRNGLLMACALVVDKDDPSKLAFRLGGSKQVSDARAKAVDGVYFDNVNNFNGNLIHTSILDKVGNVKKEMFIWGDEEEFLYRVLRNNITVGSVVSAIHYHPRSRIKRKKLILGLMGQIAYNLGPIEYCYHRNKSYLLLMERGYLMYFAYLLMIFVYYVLYDDFAIRKCCKAVKYSIDGATGKFALPPFATEQ